MTLRQRISNNKGAVIGSCVGLVAAGVLLSSVPALREEVRDLEGKQAIALTNVLATKGDGGYRSCALLEATDDRTQCIDTTGVFLVVDRDLTDANRKLNAVGWWPVILTLLGSVAGQIVDTFIARKKAIAALAPVIASSEKVIEAPDNLRTVLNQTGAKGDPS